MDNLFELKRSSVILLIEFDSKLFIQFAQGLFHIRHGGIHVALLWRTELLVDLEKLADVYVFHVFDGFRHEGFRLRLFTEVLCRFLAAPIRLLFDGFHLWPDEIL